MRGLLVILFCVVWSTSTAPAADDVRAIPGYLGPEIEPAFRVAEALMGTPPQRARSSYQAWLTRAGSGGSVGDEQRQILESLARHMDGGDAGSLPDYAEHLRQRASRTQPESVLLIAWILDGLGDPSSAAEVLEVTAASAKGLGQRRALILLSDVLRTGGESERATAALKQAAAGLASHGSEPSAEEIAIAAAIEERKRPRPSASTGDPVLDALCAARSKRDAERWKEAVSAYQSLVEQHPDHPLAETARLEGARCSVQVDDVGAAESALAALVAESAAHRGDALLELARIAITHRFDVGAAGRALELMEVEATSPDDERWSAIAALADQPTPKQINRAVAGLASGTGTIINEATVPDYAQVQHAESLRLGLFLALVAGDAGAAQTALDRLRAAEAKGLASAEETIWQATDRLAIGVELGHLFAEPPELVRFTGRQRCAVLYADFLYVSRRFDAALSVCRRLLEGEAGTLDRYQRAYVQFLEACCLSFEADRATACEALEAAMRGSRRLGYTNLRMRYAYASLGRHAEDPDDRERARQVLAELANERQASRPVFQARILLAVDRFEQGHFEEAQVQLSRFDHAPDDLAAAARAYAALLAQARGEN